MCGPNLKLSAASDSRRVHVGFEVHIWRAERGDVNKDSIDKKMGVLRVRPTRHCSLTNETPPSIIDLSASELSLERALAHRDSYLPFQRLLEKELVAGMCV